MKKFLSTVAILFAFLLFAGRVMAATLTLTSIGGVVTGGTIASFETTKTSPTFVGTAAPDATVDIAIDDLTVAVTADPDGDWTYTPAALTEGEHEIEISSNLETLTFTLTIGDGTQSSASSSAGVGGAATNSGQTTKGGLPVSGSAETTMLLIAGGIFLLGSGVIAHQLLPSPEDN